MCFFNISFRLNVSCFVQWHRFSKDHSISWPDSHIAPGAEPIYYYNYYQEVDTDETGQCDSLLGKRRRFTSRGEKQKPCGMTLPQLELWDKGRWGWEGKQEHTCCLGLHSSTFTEMQTSLIYTSWAGWMLQPRLKLRIPVWVDHSQGINK